MHSYSGLSGCSFSLIASAPSRHLESLFLMPVSFVCPPFLLMQIWSNPSSNSFCQVRFISIASHRAAPFYTRRAVPFSCPWPFSRDSESLPLMPLSFSPLFLLFQIWRSPSLILFPQVHFIIIASCRTAVGYLSYAVSLLLSVRLFLSL